MSPARYVATFLAGGIWAVMVRPARCGEAELEALMGKMGEDVLQLVDQIETIYKERCSDETLEQCPKNNYDNCLAMFPGQTCPGGDQLNIASCGDGVTCAGLFDYTVTNVRLPKSTARGVNGNPTNPQVIETVCYTRQAEDWFLEKYRKDMTFWDTFGVVSPPMYFGAIDGTFRIFPARHSSDCHSYDPRKRPWYIAGSSGPKDVVLILDTSGSMTDIIDLMQKAARRIVETLTVADRVAVIEFNTDAKITEESGRLVTATAANKAKLLDAIDQFEPLGKTNFYDAFNIAFDAFEDTIDLELHSGCNAAILFFTDGEMTDPIDKNETHVIDLIKERKTSVEQAIKHPLTIFTYSVGDDDVHKTPKNIACQTGGLWSRIDDERTLADRMSSYYKLFALGLGVDRNQDFTAWVEPYTYATGDILGTTVSSPVYDRSRTPPLFIGVAGFDFTLGAIDKALGVEAGSQETLDAVVRKSTAKCPQVSLTLCELESLRRQASGNEALCTSDCGEAEFVGIEPEQCPAVSDYPDNLWINTNNKGVSYLDRVCCKVGGDAPSDQCPGTGIAQVQSQDDSSNGGGKLNAAAIIGIACGVVAFVILIYVACRVWQTKQEQQTAKKVLSDRNSSTSSLNVETPVPVHATPINANAPIPATVVSHPHPRH